jgi:hypothetical protein
MELYFSPEDRYKYLKKDWSRELSLKGFYLISRIEYFPVKFELIVELFNPESTNNKLIILFSNLTSFIDILHEIEPSDEDEEDKQVEDPIDWIESKKDNITEYFIYTNIRELWFRTNESPKTEILS